MSRLKVVIVHNFYRLPGGEDRVLAAEAAMLRTFGHQVVEYTRHNSEISMLSKPSLAASTFFNRRVYQELKRLIRHETPDVVHVHNTHPLISPAAHYAAKAEGVPVIQTLHNYRLFCPQGLFWRGGQVCEDCVQSKMLSPAVRYGCYRDSRLATGVLAGSTVLHRVLRTWDTRVDTFITPSEYARSKLVECGISGDRIEVKPHFIDPDPGPGRGAGGYGLFVGRLAPEKGLDILLSAVQQIEGQVPIWVAGQGPIEREIRSDAKDVSAMRFLGQRTGRELEDLIGDATFLVVPSTFAETFGRVVIEAFAKGTPVIAARIGALTELIAHRKSGLLFRPADSRELADQIRWFLAERGSWPQMRKAARDSYISRYTAARNHEVLRRIYERAIERSRSGERI